MPSTRQKIIDAAVDLFNKQGYVNVRMRDIATALDISPGNLTYHFPRKADLLQAIHRHIIEQRQSLLNNVQLVPSIANIHQQLIPLLQSYDQFRFFYRDILEIIRAHPALASQHREHIKTQISYIEAILAYSVGSGNMHPEMLPGQHRQLAHTVWMLLSFWMTQQEIRGVAGDLYKDARSAMWNLVFPLLTEKGRQNFRQINENTSTEQS